MSIHPALSSGNVAVITGAAYGGIGHAIAKLLGTKFGMKLALADISSENLAKSVSELTHAPYNIPIGSILPVTMDVTKYSDMEMLRDKCYETYGNLDVLILNAAVGLRGTSWTGMDNWKKVMSVNFEGVLNGVQAFSERMIGQGGPGAIVVTGSKQGITCPPGNAAYNVSKAAVKALTEQLAHDLRNSAPQITAHLLVPGYTYTKLSVKGEIPDQSQRPASAWSPDQVAEELLERMGKGDFYIICPDNDVDWKTDQARMEWAMGDIIQNRPALSRWHDDYKEAFATHIKERTGK